MAPQEDKSTTKWSTKTRWHFLEYHFIFIIVLLMVGLFIGQGCTKKKAEDDYLLRVKNQVLTLAEFNQAVDAAGIEAFSGQKNIEKAALNDLRMRVLNQATEEMVITAFAMETGIQISDAEVDQAIAAIKADYPDNTFEETLLENAVSFQYWKKRLATRMLVEKVISKELVQQVQISSDDIAEYYKNNYPKGLPEGEKADEVNQRIVNHLRQQKAEKAYKDWVDTLRQSYPVEINRAAWERLTGTTP
ncbi:MAG: SurA N-terminal domain-containing protein [Desulfobacteraceae bacterium]|nr:SurA N-terminal domain-containing protein [Desulfobacteraceae bacterium]